jgi:hypothetical protein
MQGIRTSCQGLCDFSFAFAGHLIPLPPMIRHFRRPRQQMHLRLRLEMQAGRDGVSDLWTCRTAQMPVNLAVEEYYGHLLEFEGYP